MYCVNSIYFFVITDSIFLDITDNHPQFTVIYVIITDRVNPICDNYRVDITDGVVLGGTCFKNNWKLEVHWRKGEADAL